MQSVLIYTDGACKGNPGPGGWGAILIYGEHRKKMSGAEILTTNNRMELMGAIMALRALNRKCKIVLTTDSMYVKQGITDWLPKWQAQGWKTSNKKAVKNQDLWEELSIEVQRHEIQWEWVKGHSGHPLNDEVDELARKAIDKLER